MSNTTSVMQNGEVEINLVDIDGRKYTAKALVGGNGQMNRANFYNTIERLANAIFREFEDSERIYK